MEGDIPDELDDLLFFVNILGDKPGQDQIEREAKFRNRKLDFSLEGTSSYDFAMAAWLHDWPNNKDILEAAYARAKIHSKSSYVYNPMLRDIRPKFINPSEQRLLMATDELNEYFTVQEALGKGTNIIKYDFDKEVWFLIRYPGQVVRHEGLDPDGNSTTHVFVPAEYDAVIYHKEFGDLRLNTNRGRDQPKYLETFGNLLFGEIDVFDRKAKMIHLNPLRGSCRHLFKNPQLFGLEDIYPVEVKFTTVSKSNLQHTYKAYENITLWNSADDDEHLLPKDTSSVATAKFRYRLLGRKEWGRVTVHEGRKMTYERDGDSSILEDWLRRWNFVQNPHLVKG